MSKKELKLQRKTMKRQIKFHQKLKRLHESEHFMQDKVESEVQESMLISIKGSSSLQIKSDINRQYDNHHIHRNTSYSHQDQES